MPIELAALFLPTFLHEQAVRRLSPFDRDPYVKIDAWKAVRRITSLVLNPCGGPMVSSAGSFCRARPRRVMQHSSRDAMPAPDDTIGRCAQYRTART
jgi:hypothetical protein